jgi:hypothetical protein
MTSRDLERLTRAVRVGADDICALEAACEFIIISSGCYAATTSPGSSARRP